MSLMPLVSIIVPIYNVESYVEECVHSIFIQTYRNTEIILVDDGSTDRSGVLCEKLEENDDRVITYHKENGGLSDARNYGLARCHGEWVSFVDGDDYLSPVFIETLLCAAVDNNCDISALPFGKPFKDGDKCGLLDTIPNILARPLDTHTVQEMMLYQSLDTGAPWRLYRRETLGVDPFPKDLYYEDLASVYKIIKKVDRVAVLDCCELYAYRMRSNSIIRQEYRHIKAESALRIADQLYRDICEWYPDLSDAVASRCFSLCRMVFAQIPSGSMSNGGTSLDRDALWTVLRRYRRTVFFDHKARKRERLAAAVAFFGKASFSLFCRACRSMGLLR